MCCSNDLKQFVSIGVNLKGFPSGTLGAFVSSTVFTIFLAVSCFVLWLYWVYLNVFQAVLALLGAGVVLALSGRSMLKHFYSINGLSVVV